MQSSKITKFKFHSFILIFSILIFSLVICFALSKNESLIFYPSVQEYTPGERNIKGNVDAESLLSISDNFAIGANKNGYAVFKNPLEAFDTFVELYAQGIQCIQEANHLSTISHENYEDYKLYGWQTAGTTETESNQAVFVSKFLDIYENSFKGN